MFPSLQRLVSYSMVEGEIFELFQLMKCTFTKIKVMEFIYLRMHLWSLFLMLRRFPLESKGRRKKLKEVQHVKVALDVFVLYTFIRYAVCYYIILFHQERLRMNYNNCWWWQVGFVTVICFTCFIIRTIVVCVWDYTIIVWWWEVSISWFNDKNGSNYEGSIFHLREKFDLLGAFILDSLLLLEE